MVPVVDRHGNGRRSSLRVVAVDDGTQALARELVALEERANLLNRRVGVEVFQHDGIAHGNPFLSGNT